MVTWAPVALFTHKAQGQGRDQGQGGGGQRQGGRDGLRFFRPQAQEGV